MATHPILISTWSFGRRANRAAWPVLSTGGAALDAVEQACTAIEEDPEVDSVGFGGLPDLSGEVSLDAAIMLSPARCGSVSMVREYLHVTTLARKVMENTPHRMLAGEGAERFAEQCGLARCRLLSDDAARAYEAWMKTPHETVDQSRDRGLVPSTGIRPVDRDGSGRLFHIEHDRRPDDLNSEERWKHGHDTISTLAIDSSGVMAGACSTSGTAYKMPGRVGDSPIIGAGLYVDPEVGGAAATGTGELMIGTCASFLIVERMRAGAGPVEAIREAVERIDRTGPIQPHDQAAFIALSRDGAWGSGALRGGFKAAVRDASRDEVVDPDFALRGD